MPVLNPRMFRFCSISCICRGCLQTDIDACNAGGNPIIILGNRSTTDD